MLVDILRKTGLDPIVPEGSFFISADISKVDIPQEYMHKNYDSKPVMTRDWAFSEFLTQEIGVTTIPFTAFYDKNDKNAP